MIFKKKLLLLGLIIFTLINCKNELYKKYSKKSYSMGTFLEVSFFSTNKKKANLILKECFKLADNLEKKASCKLNNSIISIINKKKDMIIHDDFIYKLIIDSVNFSKITNGAFDPSLYHVIDLWGFDSGKSDIPGNDKINDAMRKSGYSNIILHDKRIILKNGVSLNLGGIAKGRIIGEVANYLKSNGIKNFLINGGGDIIIEGMYQGKRLWRIAVIDPFENDKFIGLIKLKDCSIVTSGDYQRNFIGDDGVLYHHIIDPTTGYPVKNGLHSVTVIADKPAKADAYATALFVMGKEEGLAFAGKNKDIEAIFITGSKEDKRVFSTNNIIINKNDTDEYNFIYK